MWYKHMIDICHLLYSTQEAEREGKGGWVSNITFMDTHTMSQSLSLGSVNSQQHPRMENKTK